VFPIGVQDDDQKLAGRTSPRSHSPIGSRHSATQARRLCYLGLGVMLPPKPHWGASRLEMSKLQSRHFVLGYYHAVPLGRNTFSSPRLCLSSRHSDLSPRTASWNSRTRTRTRAITILWGFLRGNSGESTDRPRGQNSLPPYPGWKKQKRNTLLASWKKGFRILTPDS
jgi:hypothetical protein